MLEMELMLTMAASAPNAVPQQEQVCGSFSTEVPPSPLQLNAASRLYGVQGTPVGASRILQLGCGTAANLLSFAAAYPQAHVVGIDISNEKIEHGRKLADVLKIGNLELHIGEWQSIRAEFGAFDYIIASRLFGRLNDDDTAGLFRILLNNLTPRGIAYIDYRTYPGWKIADIIRDVISLHSHGATSDEELLGSARSALSLLAEGIADENPYAGVLADLVSQARGLSDGDLVLDYLLGRNAGQYFVEFVDKVNQAGLCYVGDAEPQQEIATTFGNHVALAHSLISLGKSKILRQQYLDFSTGRRERRALLVPAGRENELKSSPDISVLMNSSLATCSIRVPISQGQPIDTQAFRALTASRASIAVTDSTVANVIETLTHAWPLTLTYKQLIEHVPKPVLGTEGGIGHEQSVAKAIEFLFQKGVLHYSTGEGPYDEKAGTHLSLLPGVMSPLTTLSPDVQIIQVFNFWNDPVEFSMTAVDRFLLPLIDGSRSFGRLVGEMETAFEDGSVDSIGNWSAMDTAARHMQAVTVTANLIDRLKRAGLAIGSPEAWRVHFSDVLRASNGKGAFWHEYLDAVVLHAYLSKGRRSTDMKEKARGLTSTKEFKLFRRMYISQDWHGAEEAGRKFVKIFPDYGIAWHILGDILRHLGRLDEGIQAMTRAIALMPLEASMHAALGLLQQQNNQLKQAEASYLRALSLDPDCYAAHTNLATFLKNAGKFSQAIAHGRKAIKVDPNSHEGFTNLANVLNEDGQHEESLEMFRKAVALQPDFMASYSNLLFVISHSFDITPEDQFEAHREFGIAVQQRAPSRVQPHVNARDPNRRVRVGFVSADLRNHAVSNFVEPIWACIDRNEIEIYAYSNHIAVDAYTYRLKPHTSVWHNIVGMDDAAVDELIRKDKIDILVDLSGHTADNRLPLFARRPAPVQVSWIGYPATTGMTSMDYYLIDRHGAPTGLLDSQFTEKLVYLPSVAAFQPYIDSPDVNSLPALANGYITFGSFNRANKISETTLELWARVLLALPNARMLLGGTGSLSVQERLLTRFEERGIKRDRLILRPRASMHDYLKYHNEIDAILDTFPYTGGTTTNHALWMGIPVVTMRGRTWASCQTAAGLSHVNLHDWVTDSPDTFVERAISIANQLPELASIRADLRRRMQESDHRVPRSVTRGVEAAFRKMWRLWCEGKSPESFIVSD